MEDPSVYAKYLNTESSGCEGCSGTTENCNDCSCCPPGLVGVYVDGVHAGCLTPSDALDFNAQNVSCESGFVALYKNGTPNVFLGCVPSDEFAALYAAVNPA